jgi:hypothetical protein
MKRFRVDNLITSRVELTPLYDIRVSKVTKSRLCILFFEFANHQFRLTKKKEKNFYVTHRSRQQMTDNYHNTLGYHMVEYMQNYFKGRRVTKADCRNIVPHLLNDDY